MRNDGFVNDFMPFYTIIGDGVTIWGYGKLVDID